MVDVSNLFLNIFWKANINILRFDLQCEAVDICAAQSCIVVAALLMCRFDKPKYTCLFILVFVSFISTASKFSGNHFVVSELDSNTRWLLILSAITSFTLCDS